MSNFEEAPIIHATSQQFTNFYEFLEKEEEHFSQLNIGMIKIIPPNIKCIKGSK